MEVETDVIRKVYCEVGEFITIAPWSEVPGVI